METSERTIQYVSDANAPDDTVMRGRVAEDGRTKNPCAKAGIIHQATLNSEVPLTSAGYFNPCGTGCLW